MDAFWRNPERYRLTYECNLVPITLDYGLSRGISFHLIKEGKWHGLTDAECNVLVAQEVSDQQAGVGEAARSVRHQDTGNRARVRRAHRRQSPFYRG